MPIKLILRLVLAVTFATIAVIYSELIPPIPGANPTVVKILVTFIAGALGFALFPDLATQVTRITISLFNLTINRLTAEISGQLLRLQRDNPRLGAVTTVPSVGGITLSKPLILDTSAIIDGRILDIAKTGFVAGLILIPSFILLELQQVADSSDNIKRQRGRRGFEIVEEFKKVSGIKIEIWDKDAGGKTVDDKLLKLAKSLHGKIITTDFNLNKLAGAHGVGVLNVNDLANAVKVAALPGEVIELKIVHIGKDSKQGVGYLPDGTMIVVEDGAEQLGQTIKIEVSRVLQGSAGRMVFGRKS